MMTPHVREHQAEILSAISAAPDLFCFLDYDGTLAPIAQTPGEAAPLPGTLELLEALVGARRTQVALVSGRAIDDVRGFLDVSALYYVGIHGLELRRPGEQTQASPSAAVIRSLMPAVLHQLEERLRGRAGIFFEDKGAAVACHYRLSSREDARAARDAVVAVVRSYQRRGVSMTFIDGHEVTEIRPVDANKGKAVCALLSMRRPAPLALYIGDDRTDEDAFQQLPPNAITIRVGASDQETVARFLLADPNEVQTFLSCVVAARSGAATSER